MATFKEQVMTLFLQEMSGEPEMALNTSFTKYARLRDEIIADYRQLTGIERGEFMSEIALDNARTMGMI